jgi:hypothetical protein
LTYVCFVTGFTCQLVYATFVVVLRDEKVLGLVYCISAFKGYIDVRMFKEVGDFPDLGTVVCEGNPFFALVDFIGFSFILFFISIFP